MSEVVLRCIALSKTFRQGKNDVPVLGSVDLEVHAGGTTSVDVTMTGVDKGYGMRKLLHVLNLERRDVLFFGDKLEKGGNDFPVKALGIDCISVGRWEETAVGIQIKRGMLLL